ncbi:MAG: GGDEF domain-containing protein, partial [Pseudolabrys sp.]
MGLQHAEARLHDDFPQAASLLAEIERLKREVAVARARIGELEARADLDPLLDILNRRGFERDLKRAIAYVKRYGTQAALMFIDLDGFKAVNDLYGHGVGDRVLQEAGQRLLAFSNDTHFIARLGGDEFGIIVDVGLDPAGV